MKADFIWDKQHIVGIAVITMLSVWALCCVLCSFSFLVQIQADGKTIQKKCLFPTTVSALLEKQGIELGKHDSAEPGIDTPVNTDMTIEVIRAVHVHILADGRTSTLATIPITQAEAVAKAGIQLGERDFIENETIFPVTDGQTIHVVRVTQEYEENQREIPFTTERRLDSTLERGITRTIQAGINGQAVDTVAITYYDGEEASRHIVSSETTQEPQLCIVAEGNLTNVSRGGQRIAFQQAYEMQASAYTYSGRRTSSGKHPAVGLIAVDPRVIPLGTHLYVDGYGYATAADTGGAIKGQKVDLFFESTSECLRWGTRKTKVYVLK